MHWCVTLKRRMPYLYWLTRYANAPGKYTAFVKAHGQTSNAGSITIGPPN